MFKILVCGHPGAGKTTLAKELGAALGAYVKHTDDLKELPWSEQSEEAAAWLDFGDPRDNHLAIPPVLIIEGMTVVRALRKWLKTHATERPCDVLFWLTRGDSASHRMSAQSETILAEILPSLVSRGVAIGRRHTK